MKEPDQHIVLLITDFCKRSISDEKLVELRKWIESDEKNLEIFRHYVRLFNDARSVAFLENVNHKEAWDKIKQVLVKSKTRKIPMWVSYAASVVVIVGLSVMFLWQNNDTPVLNSENLSEDILIDKAEKRKAVLTLADGSKVNLQENATQNFAELDGSQILKDSLNSLTYIASEQKQNEIIYNEIEVPRGAEYSLTLSDGTEVWLNCDSKLKYPVSFIGDSREVILEGEGYFKVKKDVDHPFFVNTALGTVKVLGTSFNVMAYKNEKLMETALVSGIVNITNNAGKQVELQPGMLGTVMEGHSKISVKNVNTDFYTSWIHDLLLFENISLNTLLTKLGRWYDYDVQYEKDSSADSMHFSGGIKKYGNIQATLNLLEKTNKVKFEIKNELIVVRE